MIDLNEKATKLLLDNYVAGTVEDHDVALSLGEFHEIFRKVFPPLFTEHDMFEILDENNFKPEHNGEGLKYYLRKKI